MKNSDRLVKYKTSIIENDFYRVIKELELWVRKFCDAQFIIKRYTKTSTKEINIFITASTFDQLDGYMITGLIARFSELNMRLDNITKSEKYYSEFHKIKDCFVLSFEGSSLGKSYNYLYCMQNNITDHRMFPPIITKENEKC